MLLPPAMHPAATDGVPSMLPMRPCASLQMLWLSARPHLQSSWLESAGEFDSHQPHHTPLPCDDVV